MVVSYEQRGRNYHSYFPSRTRRSYIHRYNLPNEVHSRPSLCAQSFPAVNQKARYRKTQRLSYVGIEEAERIITAGVNGESDLGELILRSRRRLGTANRTLKVGVANIELVVVGCVGFQLAGFDLWRCWG